MQEVRTICRLYSRDQLGGSLPTDHVVRCNFRPWEGLRLETVVVQLGPMLISSIPVLPLVWPPYMIGYPSNAVVTIADNDVEAHCAALSCRIVGRKSDGSRPSMAIAFVRTSISNSAGVTRSAIFATRSTV